MPKHKQLFSYDVDEYPEVHEWIQSFTEKGEKSKQIRLALRAYIQKQQEEENEATHSYK